MECIKSGENSRTYSKRPCTRDGEFVAKKAKISRSSSELESMQSPEILLKDGWRHVKPYFIHMKAFTKGRWYGRPVLDVFKQEFCLKHPDIMEASIKLGRLTVGDGRVVGADYKLLGHDLRNLCRHESVVRDVEIKILRDDEDILAIDKPCSIPVHPTGKYNFNSVVKILQTEKNFLAGIYRIDRNTSGLLIFAKNLAMDQRLKKEIVSRTVKKQYVAKVEGDFPTGEVICEAPLDCLSLKSGFQYVPHDMKSGKECKTRFEKLFAHKSGRFSIVNCFNETGRTHQIRVHLQHLGYPIVDDIIYNSAAFGPAKGKGAAYGKSKDELLEDVLKEHRAELWIQSDASVMEKYNKRMEVLKSTEPDAEILEEVKALETADYDPICFDCHSGVREPRPNEYQMSLHCFRYEFSHFALETAMPDWAMEDTR